MRKETKQKIMDKKWENMESESELRRPTSSEENQERADNAHIPESVR